MVADSARRRVCRLRARVHQRHSLRQRRATCIVSLGPALNRTLLAGLATLRILYNFVAFSYSLRFFSIRWPDVRNMLLLGSCSRFVLRAVREGLLRFPQRVQHRPLVLPTRCSRFRLCCRSDFWLTRMPNGRSLRSQVN